MIYPEMISLWIITGGLFIASVLLLILAFRLMLKGKDYAKTHKELLIVAERRVREKYNAIATLPPRELASYLANAFATCLVLECSRDVSQNDYEAAERLYAASLVKLKQYIGDDTLKAIDYYYGSSIIEESENDSIVLGYVERWAMLVYRALENSGTLRSVIAKDISFESLVRAITLSV